MIESLTYAELAARLGISPEAARKKARTAKWPVRLGNDGKARVSVDFADIRPARPPSAQRPEDVRQNRVHELQQQVEALRSELRSEGARTAVIEARLELMTAERDRWHAMASRTWWRKLAG